MYPGTKAIPNSALKTSYQGSEDDINSLWTRANRIYLEAKACYRYGQDENAWCMKVTQRVLFYGLSESGVDFLELDSIQSQSIDSSYISPCVKSSRSDKQEGRLCPGILKKDSSGFVRSMASSRA